MHRIRPVCPTCRAADRPASVLTLGTVLRTGDDADDIVEGVLLCPTAGCMREHPIIDGIPIIVADIRSQIQGQLSQLLMRNDLSAHMDSLIGDCVGPDSEFERSRYHLSTYCRSHYGDLDPDDPLPPDHGLIALFERGVALLEPTPDNRADNSAENQADSSRSRGVWLDIGCSVGRTTLEMAARTDDLVLGVDLNLGMLRTAKRVATTGRLTHPLRQSGIVYHRRDFEVRIPGLPGRANVEFWACDAMALPFANRNFAGALSFNVTDCVPSPVAHLMEMGRVLAHGAQAIVTTPYDWSSNATPMQNWIGGHSQRSDSLGQCLREMRRVVSADAPLDTDTRMVIEREIESVPWHVYVHERATMKYLVHLLVTRRDAAKN